MTEPSAPSPNAAHRQPFKPARFPSRRTLRWILLAPLLALIALSGLMAATIWYLTITEETQREQALMRDVDSTQRLIRERLQRQQTELVTLTTAFSERPSTRQLRDLSVGFFAKNQDVVFLAWIDQGMTVRSVMTSQGVPSQSFDPVGSPLSRQESKTAFEFALSAKQPSYSAAWGEKDSDVEIDLHVPILNQGVPRGTLVATISLPSLLISSVPTEISDRVAFSLVSVEGRTLANTRNPESMADKPFYEVVLEPVGRSVRLRGYSYLPFNSLYNDVITTLIAGLISLAVASQILIWRNTRRRLGAEIELAEETAFRRAMENSMSTGMRVIDLNGRITYVNPAFCRMVGFSQDELIGQDPPFPYWPSESKAQLEGNLRRMLSGESPPSGLPIHIMRKDGSRLTVRMYTSPLIDQSGKQTGWMTSVTDISEQARIRQELANAQERFITVLQALDAAVSVATPDPENELLFANQAYKKWFGNSLADGHRALSEPNRGPWSDVRDVYSETVQRWFEVRLRSIQWVDGRVVELMVATDITQERASEQAQREQHARLQQTSRLVTMGEMASSLAHELNQPLTAIANYTSGAASRLRLANQTKAPVPIDDLIELLQKTAKQAERAGQVIRRIRSFVKRSDPNRRWVDAQAIVADAIELAEIDARERGLEIHQTLDDDLPILHVDQILIEQVLLNLIKNGLEAMKETRHTSLKVIVSRSDQFVMFSVVDRGHGVPQEIRDRLFDSFYTTKTDGMGMGLNICRSIIESHHGRLWFEDNPEGGCTFRFTLPLSPPKDAAVPQPKEARAT